MRPAAAGLVCLFVLGAVAPEAFAATGGRAPSIDLCRLLTPDQVATIIGTPPVGRPSLDELGCSWGNGSADPAAVAAVTIDVQPLKTLLGKKYRNLRTYLQKTTTVGIDPLPGVPGEAFSTYTVLSGPGTSDGIWVRVRKNVMSISLQRPSPVLNPSPQFDQIVVVVKALVHELRGK